MFVRVYGVWLHARLKECVRVCMCMRLCLLFVLRNRLNECEQSFYETDPPDSPLHSPCMPTSMHDRFVKDLKGVRGLDLRSFQMADSSSNQQSASYDKRQKKRAEQEKKKKKSSKKRHRKAFPKPRAGARPKKAGRTPAGTGGRAKKARVAQ